MRKKRAFSYQNQSTEEESLLNLTPLIDVVFVVLIFFILIAPMLEIDKIQLASSSLDVKKESLSSPEGGPLAIHVHGDNTIWIRSKKVSMEQLTALLKQEKIWKPSQTPQLFHDKTAQFGTYQMIKNAVESAGFEELDIILQPGNP